MQNEGRRLWYKRERQGRRRLVMRNEAVQPLQRFIRTDVNVKVVNFWTVASSLTVRLPGHEA